MILLLLAGAMGVWTATMVNWLFVPVVRLSVGVLNPIVALVAMAIPALCMIAVMEMGFGGRTRIVVRTIAGVVCIPAAVASAPLALVAALSALFGGDEGMGKLHTAALRDGSAVVVYETDLGATTGFSLLIRHERSIAPGVLRVTDMTKVLDLPDVEIEQLDDRHVAVHGEGRQPIVLELPLN